MASQTPAVVPPDARREQMLRAAAETIGERGFADTRITDVARRTGASPALVIYYFGTKDRLLTEALRWSENGFYSGVAALLGDLGSARERLEALVRRTCIPYSGEEGRDGWGLWFDLWAQALRHPEIAKDRVELDQRWRDTIAGVVREGQRSGELTADVDAEEFAVTFAALLDGLSIQVALLDPVVDPEYALTIAMRFASTGLGVDWAPTRSR
ncbi:MAG: TetR/AcrR family transcriptional regulator [Actinomycetes bacterium]